jgi:hypothetical protein
MQISSENVEVTNENCDKNVRFLSSSSPPVTGQQ